MLFNSFEYLVFLPTVFLLYWSLSKSFKLQNLFILIVSYLFYGWWDWRFLLLMAFTTLCSFLSGIFLEKAENKRLIQKLISASNIILNLVILGIFKYYNFFGENFTVLCNALGFETHWTTVNILLPVGISFYTFQALSYTIDVYQHKIKPTSDIIAFFSFISFFPQLVAGPIERATNLLPQFLSPRRFEYDKAVDGVKQILWGLIKKMVIADNCADVVNQIWGNYTEHNSLMLILAAILFTFQIYGDFSGYSDIAIGSAKLFGVNLMKNFNLPYFSRDIAEFWRKWHISLTTWFRDYIYIPLGGSREGRYKSFRNTLIIFLVSGFWHGANWTFICWGLYHALLFLPLLLTRRNRKYTNQIAQNSKLPSITESLQMITTFSLVVLGWILFRATSINEAFDYIQKIFTNASMPDEFIGKKAICFCLLLIIVEWIQRKKEHGFQFVISNKYIRYTFYIVAALIILTQSGQQVQFIYFQF